jgi:hypothetical protein
MCVKSLADLKISTLLHRTSFLSRTCAAIHYIILTINTLKSKDFNAIRRMHTYVHNIFIISKKNITDSSIRITDADH